MKSIFLIDSTFTLREYNRFGFDILLKHKVDICLWDFQKLNRPIYDKSGFISNFDISNSNINSKVFSNFHELDECNDLEGSFIFDLRIKIDSSYTSDWFREKGAIIVKFEQGIILQSAWTPKVKDYLKIIHNKTLNFGYKNLIFNIFRRVFIGHSRVKFSDIKVCSGSLSKCYKGEFEIRSHSFDYDIFLQEKDSNKDDREFILFLDSGMTNHPDYNLMNIPPSCTEEEYFPLLRAFFDKVEESTGLPVIIAIHPRILITNSLVNKFEGREVVSGRTASLVRDAKLILQHDSTAVNFVALWRIPMIVITTDQIEKSEYPDMEAQDQFFKTNRLNINKPINNIDFFEIAQKPVSQYTNYIEKFIKVNGSAHKHSAEILIQGMKEFNQ